MPIFCYMHILLQRILMLLCITWVSTGSLFLYNVVNLWNKMFFGTYRVVNIRIVGRSCWSPIVVLFHDLRIGVGRLNMVFGELGSLLYFRVDVVLWWVDHCAHGVSWILWSSLIQVLLKERTSVRYLVKIHLRILGIKVLSWAKCFVVIVGLIEHS